jgi:hypothetical protein
VASILIIHTTEQLEQASNLVDLLETSLALDAGAIVCTSLPGYARADSSQPLEDMSAAIALVDDSSVGVTQFWFDLATAWTTGRRIAVVLGVPELRSSLPVQLQQPHITVRPDRDALRTRVEDLAFDLGVSPRLGRDALRLLDQLSTLPPPHLSPSSPAMSGSDLAEPRTALRDRRVREPEERETFEPRAFEQRDTFERSPALERDTLESERAFEPASSFERDTLESIAEPLRARPESDFADTPPFSSSDTAQSLRGDAAFDSFIEVPAPAPIPQLIGDDGIEEMDELDPLELVDEPEPEPEASPVSRFSQTVTRLRCEAALDAGRAIAECSFHRDDGGDIVSELEDSFGRFIEAIGGRWGELVRLGDVELWLGATDNLLEALPSSARAVAEWYEIGFQYATLKCIAEQGVPEDAEARSVYEEMWNRSMQQLWESAESAELPRRETRRVQTQLENVIGPSAYRDYSNLAASLATLRDMARNADRPGNRYARLAGA